MRRVDAGPRAGGAELSARSFAVVVAILALQLGFAASYVGALHAPGLHNVPVAFVGGLPPGLGAGGGVIEQIGVGTRADALRLIEEREAYGAVDARSRTLIVASAASFPIASALEQYFGSARVRVVDTKPLPRSDSRGLSSFYLAVAWVFGGYLGATALGLVGAPLTSFRRRLERFATLLAYSVLSGLLGTFIVESLIGALHGHFVAVAGVGTLVVLATASGTAALQSLLGIAGTAIAIVLFVILGNPSAGGPAAPEQLDEPWRFLHGWLPNGAGTSLVRNVVYFDAHAIGGSLGALAGWILVGGAAAILIGPLRRPRDPELELAVAAGAP